MTNSTEHIILLFYKFTHISDPEALRERELAVGKVLGLTGRMLIAEEGINGTFEGTRDAVEKYKKHLVSDPRFKKMSFKESLGNGNGFNKLKIKVRDEVVTLGAGKLNPSQDTATELSASELERWYEENEDFVVLDLRNSYEIVSGYFDRTIDPGLKNFRDLPEKLKELKSDPRLKNKKIVTVCTGGIRCEKATCLMKQEGFTDVYQLKDGIHTYMQKYPSKRFKGTLFVFDNRMTTPVVEMERREVVGACTFCQKKTEHYVNDDSTVPSTKMLCCEECHKERSPRLRAVVPTV
ncbi:MAG: rhodanese-related sulfurtransferase [Candidatus Paceibacterota bacterium]